jgi:hypothetical protein
MFVCAALLAVAGIAPATAARLYVPVLGATGPDGRALPTEVWVTNMSASATRPVAARFLGDGEAGEARTFAVQRGGQMLDKLAAPGAVGLIEIDADENAVSAWVADGGATEVSEVPVIGPHDLYHAGAAPALDTFAGVDYDRLLVGAANLADKAASCEAKLFAGDNRELARIPFEVPAKSVAREDAAAWTGSKPASAQVTCNRDFYPLAVATTGGGTHVITAKGVGPNGTCQKWVTLSPQTDGSYTALVTGVFHQATGANPKGIICIRAPGELKVGRAVFEWDVTIGPWSSKNPAGVHNLGYFFGERYRSGVIGNVNGLGPNKSAVKWMQNYGMPKGSSTNAKSGYELQKGVLYHPTYIFDAANKRATLRLQTGGQEVANVSGDIKPGNGQALVVKPYGTGGLLGLAIVGEFGNYTNQHAPEMPSLGWVYGNLSIHLVPK